MITSAKIELLFQKNIIPRATYSKLNVARKARNVLAHSGTLPNRTSAEAALEAIFQLISCATSENKIDAFDSILGKCKELDMVKHLYENKGSVIPESEIKFWIGPLPPIPGEREWGNNPYETIWDMAAKEQKTKVE